MQQLSGIRRKTKNTCLSAKPPGCFNGYRLLADPASNSHPIRITIRYRISVLLRPQRCSEVESIVGSNLQPV